MADRYMEPIVAHVQYSREDLALRQFAEFVGTKFPEAKITHKKRRGRDAIGPGTHVQAMIEVALGGAVFKFCGFTKLVRNSMPRGPIMVPEYTVREFGKDYTRAVNILHNHFVHPRSWLEWIAAMPKIAKIIRTNPVPPTAPNRIKAARKAVEEWKKNRTISCVCVTAEFRRAMDALADVLR